jgi:hypothetical protein
MLRRGAHRPVRSIGVALLLCLAAGAQEEMLCAFASPADIRQWSINCGTATIAALPGKPGAKAMHLVFDPKGQYQPGYIFWNRVRRDWSGFDALVLEATNPGDTPLPGYVLVADQAWEQSGRSYWNRHNGSAVFPPGTTEWRIPVHGMYRGEAGSRSNDIKRNIDADHIVRVDFGFGRKGSAGDVYVRNLRLVKSGRPPGVWAFDFGPPQQSVMLGWTPVSQETAFTEERGYGWGPPGGTPWNGAARDTTFGTPLIQDFCESRNYTFTIATPPGDYEVMFMLENSGYWGGEQARHTWRRLTVNGRQVWEERRPDGAAHALWRFEDVESLAKDIWDLYMAPELAKPIRLVVQTEEPNLALRFSADVPWACKVAALAVYRRGDEAASGWLDEQLAQLRRDFAAKAVCLDQPSAPQPVPAAWHGKGFIAWPVDLADTVGPDSRAMPDSPSPEGLSLATGPMVRGEYEPVCLALRPDRDLGTCRLVLAGDLGAGLSAQVGVLHYNTSRGFNTIAYHIRPHTLRPVSALGLPVGITREFVVTFRAREDAAPGVRRLALRLVSEAGQELLRVPTTVDVRPVTLRRETPFLMGFFGLMPPGAYQGEERWRVLEQTLVLLREHGMNAVSGGPNWQLTGWRDGQPQIDFGDLERFFALLHKHGFERPVNGYGGLRFQGLHDRYVEGHAAKRVAEQSGLSYDVAFGRAWEAFARQSGARHWPAIFYAMCDETRVRAQAEDELAFMRLMGTITARFPDTVRASGSYSVTFAKEPRDQDDLLYWHQEFFRALDISSLNGHDPSVLAEAGRLGKDVHIYNQGRTRYSFGLYQWNEHLSGVKARWQWHLNVLHGYQFFDLDGREPDTAMLCYGRERIYPTIHFERCREGAEDFYLYGTLAALLAKHPEAAAAPLAREVLAELRQGVSLNQRQPPADYNPRRIKSRVIAACEALRGAE